MHPLEWPTFEGGSLWKCNVNNIHNHSHTSTGCNPQVILIFTYLKWWQCPASDSSWRGRSRWTVTLPRRRSMSVGAFPAGTTVCSATASLTSVTLAPHPTSLSLSWSCSPSSSSAVTVSDQVRGKIILELNKMSSFLFRTFCNLYLENFQWEWISLRNSLYFHILCSISCWFLENLLYHVTILL